MRTCTQPHPNMTLRPWSDCTSVSFGAVCSRGHGGKLHLCVCPMGPAIDMRRSCGDGRCGLPGNRSLDHEEGQGEVCQPWSLIFSGSHSSRFDKPAHLRLEFGGQPPVTVAHSVHAHAINSTRPREKERRCVRVWWGSASPTCAAALTLLRPSSWRQIHLKPRLPASSVSRWLRRPEIWPRLARRHRLGHPPPRTPSSRRGRSSGRPSR